MTTQAVPNPVTLSIPCLTSPELPERYTLLPLNYIPQGISSYEKLFQSAQVLSLKELPPLPHHLFQEVIKTVIIKLANVHMNEGEVRVMISVRRLSYPYIDQFEEDQKMVPCIPMISIFLDMTESKEVMTEEVAVDEVKNLDEGAIIYCLFVGDIDN